MTTPLRFIFKVMHIQMPVKNLRGNDMCVMDLPALRMQRAICSATC